MAKFNIEGIGDITLPDDAMWARDATMQELVSALTGKSSKAGRAETAKTEAVKKGGKEVKAFGKTLFKMNPALTALEKGFNVLGSAITGASGLVGSLSQATGRFEDLGSVVDYTSGMIKSTFGGLPIIGGLISASADATAAITKLKLSFMDMQADTFEGLASVGLGLNGNLGKTLETVLGANISLDQFNKLVVSNSDGLRVFGGTIDQASQKFAGRLERLTGKDSEVGMSMRFLGLNSESIAEEFADFITMNKRNRILMTGSEEDLNAAMLDRLKNERTLAEFTGQSVQEQRNAMMKSSMDMAFQANLIGKPYQLAMTQFGSMPGIFGQAVKEFSSEFAGPVTRDVATSVAMIPGMADLMRDTVEDVKDGSISGAEAQLRIAEHAGKFFQTEQGKSLAALGLITNVFDQVTEAGAMGYDVLTQFNTIAAMFPNQGFKDAVEAMNYFDKENQKSFTIAKTLMDKGELTQKQLEKTADIDAKTAELIIARMNTEDAVGTFQSRLLKSTTGLDGMSTVVSELTGGFNKLLHSIDPNSAKQAKAEQSGMNYKVETGLLNYIFSPRNTYTDEYGLEYKLGNDGTFTPKSSGGKFKEDELAEAMGPEHGGRNLGSNPGAFKAKAKAFGGSAYGNQLYLVGERGPELFVPSSNGTILPDQGMGVTTPGVSRMEDKIAQASSTQTSTVSAFQNALTNSRMTTSDPEAIQELTKMNRMLSRLLPKVMTSEGIY